MKVPNNKNIKYLEQFGNMYFKHNTDDTKLIISSGKCGSRYLTDLPDFTKISITTMDDTYIDNLTDIFWIVRPPLEHLLTAIITEHNINMQSVKSTQSSKIKIKVNEDKNVFDVLSTLVTDIFTEPMLTNNSGNITSGKFTHYNVKYEKLYNSIEDNIGLLSKITFVELKNLSSTLESQFKIQHTTNKEQYSFDVFFTKETLHQTLLNKFPTEYEKLMGIINVEKNYYELLINFDYMTHFNDKLNNTYTTFELLIKTYSDYKVRQIRKSINSVKNYTWL